MARLTVEQWATVRAEYEAGATINSLAKKHGVSHTAIGNKCKAQDWKQDLAEVVRRKTEEKLAGAVATSDPLKREAAADAEATRRAEVGKRHRDEWSAARALSYGAMKSKDFEAAKLAKISAETLKIIQEGERKAWGLDPAGTAPPVTVVVERY